MPYLEHKKHNGLKGRYMSVRYSLNGLRVMLITQKNAWIHAVATVSIIAMASFLRISTTGWALVLLAIVAVWTAEALNTAFEFLADVASPEFHPLVERAKDVAAGAVLISALGSVIIGLLVLGPPLLRLLGWMP